VLDQPFGAGAHVRLVLGLGGDAGEPEIGAEFVEETRLVLAEVIEDGVHGIIFSAETG
jgi:hypothetical protein